MGRTRYWIEFTEVSDSITRRSSKTYRSLADEVGNGNQLSSVSIDECLEPSSSVVVLNLDNMGQDGSAIVLGQVFESSGVLVESSRECLFGSSDSILKGDGRS